MTRTKKDIGGLDAENEFEPRKSEEDIKKKF